MRFWEFMALQIQHGREGWVLTKDYPCEAVLLFFFAMIFMFMAFSCIYTVMDITERTKK